MNTHVTNVLIVLLWCDLTIHLYIILRENIIFIFFYLNFVCHIFSPNQRAVFVENLNFYFMKTTHIPVYGNIAVYIQYNAVCLKIDYTLRCLEYI